MNIPILNTLHLSKKEGGPAGQKVGPAAPGMTSRAAPMQPAAHNKVEHRYSSGNPITLPAANKNYAATGGKYSRRSKTMKSKKSNRRTLKRLLRKMARKM